MKKVKDQLGREVCRNLLFLHAMKGCNTTSRLYGVGKATARKLRMYHASESKLTRSAAIRLYLMLLQVKKHLWPLLVESQGLVLTLSGISGTLRNLQQRHLIYCHRIYPQLQQRPDSTACASIYK